MLLIVLVTPNSVTSMMFLLTIAGTFPQSLATMHLISINGAAYTNKDCLFLQQLKAPRKPNNSILAGL